MRFAIKIIFIPIIIASLSGCTSSISKKREKELIPLTELTGKIVFSSDREDGKALASGIYIINSDGTQITKISPPDTEQFVKGKYLWNVSEYSPCLSCKADRLIYSQNTGNKVDIWMMDCDGLNRKPFINSQALGGIYICEDISWSKDNQFILAVSSKLHGKDELIIIKNIYSSPGKEMVFKKGNINSPKISPDGQKILFFGLTDETDYNNINHEVWSVNIDGSGINNLSNILARDADPSWSPDGEEIAFVSDRNGNSHVFIMKKDGSNVKQLTQGRFVCASPVWSPDGKFIAYCRSTKGPSQGHEIWVTTIDGKIERQITKTILVKDIRGGEKWSDDGDIDWK